MKSLDSVVLLADTTCTLIAASGYLVSRSGYRECTSSGVSKPRFCKTGIIDVKYRLRRITSSRLGALMRSSTPDRQSRRSRSANERS